MIEICSAFNCERPARNKGLCSMHYKRQWRHGNPAADFTKRYDTLCKVAACTRLANTYDYCKMHWGRLQRHGHTDLVRAPNGQGRPITNGYVLITLGDGRREYEHIIVAEKALGKSLPAGVIVHHADGNRSNNTPTNLVICPNQAYHMLLHKRIRDTNAWNRKS